MSSLTELYQSHISELQSRTKIVLKKNNQAEFILIHSGFELTVFLDDYPYPFKINPHFKAWLPILDVTHCWLIVNGEDKPKLLYHQPVDFWHKVTALSESYWTDYFDIEIFATMEGINRKIASYSNKAICISEHLDFVSELGFAQCNPKNVIDYFHYHRAYKTDYEHECLRRSNAIAIKGHKAAKDTFYAGKSEFDINMAYLQASQQTENETPYGSIVALNTNAAILHYTQLERSTPNTIRSFLIDAGATYHGYASDITRTYSFEDNTFSKLIQRMEILMKNAVDGLKPDSSYVDLHAKTYQAIAQILEEFEIINISATEADELGIVSTFFPHGLGHHLGMQTHDVAGFMQNEQGDMQTTPSKFPSLRTSRQIEARQVFTIEPGLYFIDSLLAALKASNNANKINWSVIEAFKPFGGIRIEDDIIVHADHNENMTRTQGLN